MNKNRILFVVVGLGALAVVAALMWKRAPDPISVTNSTWRADPAPPPVAPASELSAVPAPDERLEAHEKLRSSPPEADVTAPATVIAPETLWEKKYTGLNSEQLGARRLELNKQIGELAAPELQKMYDSGQYEVLHAGNTSGGDDWNPSVVMSLQFPGTAPGGPPQEVRRAILPEWKYPDLYAMRHEERWLDKRYYELERQELAAKGAKVQAFPK